MHRIYGVVGMIGIALQGCAPNYDHDACAWGNKGGFPAHDCPMTLMCLHDFQCPDGSVVLEYEACSGPRCSDDDDCNSSHFCYDYSDSQGYCMPLEECRDSEFTPPTSSGLGNEHRIESEASP